MVVVNRDSRRSRATIPRLYDAVERRGIRVAAFHPVDGHAAVTDAIRRAAKAGAPCVIVGGGDGTQTAAVGALVHRDTVLGVLPLGTGNSFAQSLNIGDEIEAALDVIAGGHVGTVDVGRVNGVYFANFATIGLSSAIARTTPRGLKALLGPVAYGLAALRPLVRRRAFRAVVRYDGGRLRVRTHDVVVANGRFFGSHPISGDATLDDARLTLVLREGGSSLDALRGYLAYASDGKEHSPDAHTVSATRFTIRTRVAQPVAIDGMAVGSTPARFTVVPSALRVYVPRAGIAR